jgi:hypothetical protein
MRGAALATLAAAMLVLPAAALAAEGPVWAVDPAAAGPDAPPAGRSLFDFVTTRAVGGRPVQDVPFPFERLVTLVAERAGCAEREPCVKQVLIPLGRSLQRIAGAPDFFKHPRVVVAVDGEPSRGGAPLAKDRLYLGYQETSNVVEAISWNEAAGRFEFQIVRDYRPGGRREVVYARRALCAACHQNLAPIFSRQVWDETNANPRVAAALAAAHPAGSVHGAPIRRGVDIPNAIDDATERANRYGVTQLLWREGCGEGPQGARCRAAVLAGALQYRLSGDRAFDASAPEWREAVLPALDRAFAARWPAGLAIPNPDLPNRDPLPPEAAPPVAGLPLAHVAARFEPLAPRPPLEVWPADAGSAGRRLVEGLAAHLAAFDTEALDRRLAARAAGKVRRHEAPCEVAWTESMLRFRCVPADARAAGALRLAGRLTLAGGRVTGGEIAEVTVTPDAPLHFLAVRSGSIAAQSGRVSLALGGPGLDARLADGAAIAAVELSWHPGQVKRRGTLHEATGTAALDARDDFAAVRDALGRLDVEGEEALGPRPFGRARVLPPLFARLGIPPGEWCCDDARGLPPAIVESPVPAPPGTGPAEAFAAFYPLCASCHATGERSPPNFLAGPGERVAAALKQCAPRIYVRVAVWRLAPEAREKTPMPPPIPSIRGGAHLPPAAVGALEAAAAALVRAEAGEAPQLERMLANGYESLRPCLP